MKIYISILSIICSVQISLSQVAGATFSQTGGTAESANMGLLDVMRKIKSTDHIKLSKVEGSPYLYEEWKPGKMRTIGGSEIDDIDLKYNCYSQYLVAKRNKSQDSVLVNDLLIQAFQLEIMEDSALLFRKYRLNDHLIERNEDVFYQVLLDGEVSLLKYQYKKIRHFDQETSSIVDTNRPRLVLEEELFFIKKDGTNISIKKNGKKKVLAFFGPNEKELIKYVKANKIRFHSEVDLTKLAAQHNRDVIK